MIRIDLSKKHVIFKLIFESLFSPSDCGCDLADHIMVKGIHALYQWGRNNSETSGTDLHTAKSPFYICCEEKVALSSYLALASPSVNKTSV